MKTERVAKARALEGYRIHVEFSDGLSGDIDLSDRLFGPVFEPLKDQDLFRQVCVDEFGAVSWPNGADLAPDALYRALERERKKITTKPK